VITIVDKIEPFIGTQVKLLGLLTEISFNMKGQTSPKALQQMNLFARSITNWVASKKGRPTKVEVGRPSAKPKDNNAGSLLARNGSR
jgi:hypothetical protein